MGDIFGSDFGSLDFRSVADSSKKKFLKTYQPEDLYEIMKKVGMVDHLEKIGYNDLKVTVNVDDSYVNYMKVYHKKLSPDNLLIDLRLSENRFVPDKKFLPDNKNAISYDMIVIEWLSAHNPLGKFTPDKPQLPGQKSPGLGIMNYCFDMMYRVAEDISRDGFLDIPDHVHGAIMYSKRFRFYDPAHDGVLKAMMRDLKKYSLSDISWGVITETIIEKYKDEPHVYDPSEQIFYVSEKMRRYFHSGYYKSTFNKYYKRKKFYFKYDEMLEKRKEMLNRKNIVEI